MVKDPNGIYHLVDGYIALDGEPVFLSPTECGIDWAVQKGWMEVFFLDAEEYGHLICKECTNGN